MTVMWIAFLSAVGGLILGLLVGRIGRAKERALHATLAALLRQRIDDLQREEMAREARSRGVGGTGEHSPPIVTLIPDTSNVVAFTNAGRWSIPTDRSR